MKSAMNSKWMWTGWALVASMALPVSAQTTAGPDTAKPAAQADLGMPKNDAEIAHIVTTANELEIQASKLGQQKARKPEVKEFARHMVHAHTQNNKQAKSLAKEEKIKPAKNPTSEALKTDAEAKLAMLKDASGAEFDRAFMDAQVAMHQRVLAMLDEKLIPNAKNADLKEKLNTTRSEVAEHLEQAREIQRTLIE